MDVSNSPSYGESVRLHNVSQTSGTGTIHQGFVLVASLVDNTLKNSSPAVLLGAVIATTSLASLVYLVVARLIFHPLRKFPGPRLAGLTSWYEFYYDVFCGGEYVKRIEDMHADYKSPVIRISPDHIHVNDPEFYKKLFAIASPFLKAKYFYSAAGLSEAIGALREPKKHHIHRSILSPRFAPKVISSYTPQLLKLVMKCTDIMALKAREGKHIIMPRHTRSLTVDVISEFTFGRSFGLTTPSDEEPELLRDLASFMAQFQTSKHLPLWRWFLSCIPASVSRKMMPGYYQLREKATVSVEQLIADKKAGKRITENDDEGTVLDLLLKPHPKRNYRIPGASALVDEGCAFIVGGSDTTGYTMESVTYAVLNNASALRHLRQELDDAAAFIRDDFDLNRVQQLPFLTAVIKEAMRLYTPTPGPLPREVPEKGVQCGEHFIPGGTIVSVALHVMHHNPKLFSEPKSFKPERWLGEQGKVLDQYWAPFSRGTRSCIGMNLAYHEMYTFLAILFSRFDMAVFETDDSSMEWHDHMFAQRHGPVQIKLVRDRWSGEAF